MHLKVDVLRCHTKSNRKIKEKEHKHISMRNLKTVGKGDQSRICNRSPSQSFGIPDVRLLHVGCPY